MSDEQLTPDDLSLKLADRKSPFSLVETERYFGPEDWAWQFLRLNYGYQKDYKDALERHDPTDDSPEGAFEITEEHPHRSIRLAEKYCRQQYGLSTWLDPQLPRLPKLNKGESWFYPLTHVVDTQEWPCGCIADEYVFSYYFEQGRSLHGYDKRRSPPLGPVNCQPSSAVWFAIDCSIPLNAQLKSVEVLSTAYGERHRSPKDGTASLQGCDVAVLPLKDCRRFHYEKFGAAAQAVEDGDPRSAWYALRIDVCGPIKTQLELALTKLSEAYDQLCDAKRVKPQFRSRFRNELKGPKDEDGSWLSDGFFLKGAAICARLSQSGLDDAGITKFILAHVTSKINAAEKVSEVRANWEIERVEKYVEGARKLVKGGYRWLVQAQKP